MKDGTQTAPAVAAAAPRPWIGFLLLLVAIVSFGIVNNLNKLAYSYGLTVLTLLSVRTWLIVIVLGGWLIATRQAMFLPPRSWPRLAWVGLTLAVTAFMLLTAIEYITVSLAVLTFYIFPIFVALLSAALGEMRLSPAVIGGLLAAFAGLALAIDVSVGGDLAVGVVLSIGAALGITFNLIGSHRLMAVHPSIPVTFNMMVVGAVLLTIGLAVDGGPVWPRSGEGWLVFAGTAVFGPLALVTIYAALRYVSSMTTAMVMNGEPILTVVFAVLWFGESFTPIQTVGAALVIGAILVVTRLSGSKTA